MPFSPVSRRGEVTADHIRELQRYCGDWADWTPVVTQGAATPTLTVTEAKFILVGKVCHIYAKLTITSAGAAAVFSIGGQPAAAQPALVATPIGVGLFYDADPSGNYFGIIYALTATDWRFFDTHDRISPTQALANGDGIAFTATFRVA